MGGCRTRSKFEYGCGSIVISTELSDERSNQTAFTHVVGGYVRIHRHGAHGDARGYSDPAPFGAHMDYF